MPELKELPWTYWNSIQDKCTPDTVCQAEEGDYLFYHEGVLFLVQKPTTTANLVIQRVAPSVHCYPPIKSIYQLCITLADNNVGYLAFNGAGSRYKALYLRLFKSLLFNGMPNIIQVRSDDPQHDYYVVKLSDSVLEYCKRQLNK